MFCDAFGDYPIAPNTARWNAWLEMGGRTFEGLKGLDMSEETTSSRSRVAHCACGELRAKTVGEPLIIITCFCEECQRRTASVVGVSTYWMRENVELSGRATRYVREGQGGRKVSTYFCPRCGSSVYWELPDRRPGQLGIAGGSFFDVNFPAPAMSVWERSKPSWISVSTLERFPENPPPPPLPN